MIQAVGQGLRGTTCHVPLSLRGLCVGPYAVDSVCGSHVCDFGLYLGTHACGHVCSVLWVLCPWLCVPRVCQSVAGLQG